MKKNPIEIFSKQFVGSHVHEKIRYIDAGTEEIIKRARPPVESVALHEKQHHIRNGVHETTRTKRERHPQHHYERVALRLHRIVLLPEPFLIDDRVE